MAEFLRLARDTVEKRGAAIRANDNYFLLNDAQCRRLWQNLTVVYRAFEPSLSYSPPAQLKCLPLHKEFYNIVMRADAIVDKCSNEESWLEAAVFLGGNRQIFQELSVDLQSCADLFHYMTKSLCRSSQISAPSIVIDVAVLDAVLNEDLQKDVTSLRRRLEEKQVDFTEQEKHLASYIAERDVFVPEPEPELDSVADILEPKKLPYYEIHRKDPDVLRNLAANDGAIVSKVKWLGLTCAKKEFLHVESTAGFVKEVSALVALNHSRTVKLLCSWRKMPNPYFIMEFMPMTLDAFCKKNDTSDNMRFEILPSISMMLQIALGMEYLHEQGVVHRDLKSPNILVSPSAHPGLCSEGYGDIKLTDFGLAKMKVSDDSMVVTCKMGTTLWLAPEVLGILPGHPLPRVDWRKVDTYSFGIVCSEILTGQRPYLDLSPGREMIESICVGRLRPKLPQDCPDYLSGFLSQCWATNPKDRPTFKEITQTLSGFKACLLICTVPEQAPVLEFSRFSKLWAFWSAPKNVDFVRSQVFCPDPEEKECVEAAAENIYGRMEMIEALCTSMKKLLTKVRMCHVQCEYLVGKYLEGFQEVKTVHNLVSPMDFWRLYQSRKLQQVSESLDRLLCSMMAVEELLRACGGSAWVMTALQVFAPIPQSGTYCSIFGRHLWNLYWNIFVINHVMHDISVRQPSFSWQLLSMSGTLRVQWCEERCNFVLQRITSTGVEDADDEFVQADAYRQAEDRKNLILNLTNYSHRKHSLFSLYTHIFSYFFSPEKPIEYGHAVFLKNRLQSSLDPLGLASYKFDDLKIEVGDCIGSGSWKKVVKQKWCGETVALSIMSITDDSEKGLFTHEISMLARLQHPNIVHFIGWKQDDESGYIVMELMEQDLHNLIERNTRLYSRSPFSLLVAIDILLQVVEAMIHMHKCGVIYRDLKPSNILVSPKYTTKLNAQDWDVYYTVKLTDFLTAKSCYSSLKNHDVDHDSEAFKMPSSSERVFFTTRVGTLPYMAPEVIKGYIGPEHGYGYTSAVDVYSFGMTAYEVATGLRPFFGYKSGAETMKSAMRGERPEFPHFWITGLKELIEKCWVGIPEDRPSFEHIKKDLWTLKCSVEFQR